MSSFRDIDQRLKMVEARNEMLSIYASYITRQMDTLRTHNEGWMNERYQQIVDFEKECAEKMKK